MYQTDIENTGISPASKTKSKIETVEYVFKFMRISNDDNTSIIDLTKSHPIEWFWDIWVELVALWPLKFFFSKFSKTFTFKLGFCQTKRPWKSKKSKIHLCWNLHIVHDDLPLIFRHVLHLNRKIISFHKTMYLY